MTGILISLGIDTKVQEVSILSDEFQNKVDAQNKTPKSKASEMEHAIRWHIKVNLDKDPALYNRFKDRLETILNAYKENWEEIVKELGDLRDEMAEGRKRKRKVFLKWKNRFMIYLKAVCSKNESEIRKEQRIITDNIIVNFKRYSHHK